ncbi:MAG TPA: hypothetical protein VIY30_05645 [Burkholderiaceae bacterium]
MAVTSSWRRAGAAALWLAGLAGPTLAAEAQASGELRLQAEATSVNDAGPVGAANALVPGIVPIAGTGLRVEAELRGSWHPAATRPWLSSLDADVLLAANRPQGGPTDNASRINELQAASDFGAWQLAVGKKIVGWDVGYGFRPNDVVQQERRRTLLPQTPEGRPLLEVEHFGAEQAATLVWVNPNHAGEPDDEQRGASENALAARWYARQGAADWYLFARWGEHTQASVGAALAFVATDELELHASARALQRHDGWRIEPRAGDLPVGANPWAQATLGGTSQWLLGASWTGQQQQSLLLEYWYDGTTLSDEQWDRWMARNQGLAAFGALPGLPAGLMRAAAGNLAWQATPFDTPNLRRDNLFVRLAWQPDHWLLSADALITPTDRGRIVTLGVQWQGDRLRLNAAWRAYGGPANSLFAQLPQRRVGVLAAAWAF